MWFPESSRGHARSASCYIVTWYYIRFWRLSNERILFTLRRPSSHRQNALQTRQRPRANCLGRPVFIFSVRFYSVRDADPGQIRCIESGRDHLTACVSDGTPLVGRVRARRFESAAYVLHRRGATVGNGGGGRVTPPPSRPSPPLVVVVAATVGTYYGNTTFCDAVQLSPNPSASPPSPLSLSHSLSHLQLPPYRPRGLGTRPASASPCLLLPPTTLPSPTSPLPRTVYPFVHSSKRTHRLTGDTLNRTAIAERRIIGNGNGRVSND